MDSDTDDLIYACFDAGTWRPILSKHPIEFDWESVAPGSSSPTQEIKQGAPVLSFSSGVTSSIHAKRRLENAFTADGVGLDVDITVAPGASLSGLTTTFVLKYLSVADGEVYDLTSNGVALTQSASLSSTAFTRTNLTFSIPASDIDAGDDLVVKISRTNDDSYSDVVHLYTSRGRATV